jgi:hypothetical protein
MATMTPYKLLNDVRKDDDGAYGADGARPDFLKAARSCGMVVGLLVSF